MDTTDVLLSALLGLQLFRWVTDSAWFGRFRYKMRSNMDAKVQTKRLEQRAKAASRRIRKG